MRKALRRLPRWARRALGAAGVTAALLSGLAALNRAVHRWPLPGRLEAPPSALVRYRDGSLAHVFVAPDGRYRLAARLEAIDPDYVEALLRYEDKRFASHPGVDPLAVARAAWANLRAGRVVSGASTLTMQLVRVLEPRPRTLGSKLIEAARALQLERRLGKRKLLEAYLTFIPFGGNLEGVETAAYAYFGHSARELSADEIAVLLAVPQRPQERYPDPANAAALRTARDAIARWLGAEGALPDVGSGEAGLEQALEAVARSRVPRRLRPMPRGAPHAAAWLRLQSPAAREHVTTLDAGLQRLAERVLERARDDLGRLGIHNGAAVVIDHERSEVRALVGSLDFWDEHNGGQIVGFDVPRSPGSTMKPLIYALALDRGLALPDFLVPDVPVSYGSYAPENYDGRFAGLVRLEDALSRSLNVPFVDLLGELGVERFVGTLRSAGAARLAAAPGRYGLSAAIGGIELTPLEVASLYATLAADGVYRPLRWRAAQPPRGAVRVLSPGAAWLTRRALARRDRPDFPERRRWALPPARIHWKTGTSYGHRDAWAAGSGPRHTAVVWLGNFDRTPAHDLVGADAAGPLLFDLLEALADRARPDYRPGPPGDLKPVTVCALSGRLPGDACPRRREALALRKHVPVERCPYHVAIDVERATGLALNPGCRAGRAWETRGFTVWPAGVRRYLAPRQRLEPAPPALAPGCVEERARSAPPAIVSPAPGQVLLLIPGLDASEQEVPLEAESTSGQLAWFVNGTYLATARPDERLWWTPEPGRHELLVADAAGRTTRRRVEVRAR